MLLRLYVKVCNVLLRSVLGHSRPVATCNVCYLLLDMFGRRLCGKTLVRCFRWNSGDSRALPLKMLKITHSSGETEVRYVLT